MRTECPANTGFVENLSITNEAIDMRLSKKVSRRCHQQDFCAFDIQWILYFYTIIIKHIFFKTFKCVGKGWFR